MSPLVLPLTLLLLGAHAHAGKAKGQTQGKGPGATQAKPGPQQGQALVLPPFSAAQPLAPLGLELSRAVAAELARLRIDTLRESRDAKDRDARIEGQVTPTGGTGLLLRLSLRGATAEVPGDLEDLSGLAQKAALRIQSLLRDEPPGKQAAPTTPGKPATPDKDKDRPPIAVTPAPPVTPAPVPAPVKEPDHLPLPPPPDLAQPPPPPATEPPRPPPVTEPPRVDPPREKERDKERDRAQEEVRVAVHIIGEPQMAFGRGAFYGVGLQGQQALLTFLRRRLHVQAVSSPLTGLVRGEEAREVSLRQGAPFTLMARFDSLHISSAGPGPGYGQLSLTGRVHLVLLYQGIAILDRRAVLPPTPFSQTESPGSLVARALTTVMEGMADELSQRIHAALGR
jgi:hypothetical protein